MEHSAETERVWREMHERLLGYITNRVATPHDAEDILQDVFIRIHANLPQLKDTESITAWVYQIARNAITDYHRKRATVARALTKLAEDADETREAASDEPDIVREAREEFTGCLEPLLNELPEHYRQAITLTELNGVTQKDAAAQLGLSVSGVKARVRRGRGKFKDVILDCCNVELDRRGGLVDYQRRGNGTCEGCDCG
ncbi:MAG: RNA polymerase sigma factor SigZ [Planctomycetota bacterium]|jgi:RNA polymerase sigma-70 factor (ECF subfamily)